MNSLQVKRQWVWLAAALLLTTLLSVAIIATTQVGQQANNASELQHLAGPHEGNGG